MAFPELNAQRRTGTGKGAARKLRAQGMIPGVFYGPQSDPVPVTVDPLALRKLILKAPARNFLLNLNLENKTEPAMLKGFQMDPVSRQLLHADFLRIRTDQAVTLEVPVELLGTPEGVVQGGALEVVARYVKVTGLPDALPEAVSVEVSGLKIGDVLKVSDLELTGEVSVEDDPDTVLCTVTAPIIIEAAAEAAEAAGEAEAAEGEAASKAQEPDEEEG